MPHEGLKYDRVNIQLRRSKVLSLLARGMQKQDIATELGVAPSTISVDCQFLQENAADEIQHHISEIIPFHYKIVIQGYRDILLTASNIVQNSTDDKTKLSALGLMATIYDRILAADTNGPIIGAASSKAKALETNRFILKEIEEAEPEQDQTYGGEQTEEDEDSGENNETETEE